MFIYIVLCINVVTLLLENSSINNISLGQIGKLQRLVEVYFKGWEVSTMRSYESSFRKLGGLC
jgi:hypothetical protein